MCTTTIDVVNLILINIDSPRYKQDKLVRRSAWDRSPKLYSTDAFNVSCDVSSIDGSSVSLPGDHQVIIFDEKGEQFAATYFNCPVRNGRDPHQVHILINV